jgi:hypothetical protein
LLERAWIELRDSGRSPLDCTDLVTSLRQRAEFLVGAWLIDAIVPPSLGGSLLNNLQPQMLREADVLGAHHFRNAILEPRRSAKTTSLWCVLLGRCYLRPMHMAGYTMLTTAKKTTERFRIDIFGPIARRWSDAKTRPVKLINSNGFERVEFHNGSVLAILSPEGDAVRSGAYDTLVLDEAGEAEPAKWADIVAAVVPSFDTRGPEAQLILAGTGGRYRIGSYFWKTLHDPDAGRLRYGVPDDVATSTIETWDGGAGALIEQLHPGLDGLTSLAKIHSNFGDLGWEKFALEYLGHFGDESGIDTAVSSALWLKTTSPGAPPAGIKARALSFALHPGGLWASIGVAWHMDDGPADLAAAAWALDGTEDVEPRVAFKLIHHQEGTAGLPGILYRYWHKLRLPIVYDDAPQEKAVMQDLMHRARPRPQTNLVRFSDKAVATTNALNRIKHGSVVHWEQAPLDKAAATATIRMSGKSRLFGIPDHDPTADITGMDAMALALQALPSLHRQSIGPIVVD